MNKRIKFLTNKINENPYSIFCAIEDIDIEFCSEDGVLNSFKILDILSIDKRSSVRTDFMLQITAIVNDKEYDIENWFVYNYKTKEFEHTMTYSLQFE